MIFRIACKSYRSTLLSLKLYVCGLKGFRTLASVYVGAIIDRPAGKVAFLSEFPANSQHFWWAGQLSARKRLRIRRNHRYKSNIYCAAGASPCPTFADEMLLNISGLTVGRGLAPAVDRLRFRQNLHINAPFPAGRLWAPVGQSGGRFADRRADRGTVP